MAKLAIKPGSTDVSIQVFVGSSASATGAGLTGLTFETASLTCYYCRPGAAAAALTLATQTVDGAHSDGGFVEIDATNMPGWYRLDLSDAVVAAGVRSVGIHLQGAANMAPTPLEIDLSNQTDVSAWNSVPLSTTNPLPNAAADAPGGLPISYAGGLDLDTLLAILSNGTYGLAAIKALMDAFATDADIAQATWDALLTAILTDGSIGKLIKDYLDAAISTRSTYSGGEVASVAGAVGSVGAGGISNASFDADVGSTAYATNIIALAVRKVLDELNLDHLAKTATAAADMTTEVADNTILSRILANGDTSAFDPSTDSLEAQSVQAAATSLLLNAVHKGSFQAAANTPSAGYTTWTLYDLDDNLIATFVTTDATGSRAKAT